MSFAFADGRGSAKHFAKIALVAHILGNEQLLGEQDIEKLILARDRYAGPVGWVDAAGDGEGGLRYQGPQWFFREADKGY